MNPKISVIIPTYNLAKILVERAISSVLSQTYDNLECLIIDDGSTDDTELRVQELIKKDSRLKYFKIKNSGQSAAKNFGVEQAVGEFVAFNDHDDAYLPMYLERAMSVFKKLPQDVAFLSSGVINRDENRRESYYLPALEPFWKLSIGNGWIFRRAAFMDTKIKSETNMSGFEDLDLHLKFRQKNYKGYVIDEPLRVYFLRIKPSSSSLNMKEYHSRFTNSFENFFSLYEDFYNNLGPAAISWLCFFGGLVNLRAGRKKRGRFLLKKSFLVKPSLLSAIYYSASFFGYNFFMFFDNFKNNLMRVLRSKWFNRYYVKA